MGDVLSRYVANQQADAKPAFTGTQIFVNPDPGPGGYSVPTFTDAGANGGSTSGGGSTSPDPTALANDWYKAFFSNFGVPADVQNSLIDILKKYASDPSIAQTLATQYLRTTPWYQTTFPGFSAGVSNGIFTDETGYRNYLNSINSVYNQYLGRHVSGDELTALLNEGAAPQLVANRFQGQAYIQANSPEIQYLGGAFGNGRLTQDQLTALGNENAGIDTAQGQLQQKILAKAQQIQQKLFTGQLATPNLSLGANGLGASSLLGTNQKPDVAA